MKLSKLLNLSLDEKGFEQLVNLPQPSKSAFNRLKPKFLAAFCKKFSALWLELMLDENCTATLSFSVEAPCNRKITLKGEKLWQYVAFKIAAYYDFAIHRYITMEDRGAEIPLPNNEDIVPVADSIDGAERSAINDVRAFSVNYFHCLRLICTLKLLRSAPIWLSTSTILDSPAHRSLQSLSNIALTIMPGAAKTLSDTLYKRILALFTLTYSEEPLWNIGRGFGPFSSINTMEVIGIAKCDVNMIKKYREKNIPDVFEKQLSLIIQSFGFFVIPSRKGRSNVDLLCITRSSKNNYTFLLEAKSSKNIYSFPSKDRRAIVEYVCESRELLANLPELSFVIIAGPKPSHSIDKKLREIEKEIGLPVRYCQVEHIARLRDGIPGSIQPKAFRDAIINSSSIIGEDSIKAIIDFYYKEQESYKIFIESIYDSYKAIRP